MSLLNKRLILVLGKGGVGRSTVAASIASATAQSGRKTLLYEANAKDRFGEFFDRPAVGPKIVKLRENLFAVNTTPEDALEEYGMMILKFRRVYQMVFENRITEAFLKAVPGIEEYSILGKVWNHTKEKDWDTIVFDMAASGHSLSMLRIPSAIVSAIPDGPLTRDAKTIQALLSDPAQTAAVIVTLAEDMPSNEAIELQEQLVEHLGLKVHTLVVNQLYRPRFPVGGPQDLVLSAAESSPGSEFEDVVNLAAQYRAREHLNVKHLASLEKAFTAPMVRLYRHFVSQLSSEQIDEFGQEFARAGE